MTSDIIATVSVLLNVLLLYVLVLAKMARQCFEAMSEGEDPAAYAVVRPDFKRHLLVRYEDVSGISGKGVVCEVAEFSDGHAVVHWINSPYPWTTPCPEGIAAIEKIHGHGGKTKVVPLDAS